MHSRIEGAKNHDIKIAVLTVLFVCHLLARGSAAEDCSPRQLIPNNCASFLMAVVQQTLSVPGDASFLGFARPCPPGGTF